MWHAIFINLLLFFSLFFTGHQLLAYKGMLGGFNVSLSVNINYNEISQNEYNVTITENGLSINNTLGLKSQIHGKYYYIVNYSNNRLSITYCLLNSSGVVLYPFYLPFNLHNGSLMLYISVYNGTNHLAYIIANSSVKSLENEIVLNFTDFNLTADPIYYVSALYEYKNGVLNNVIQNYSNSYGIFLETQLTLDNSSKINYLIIATTVVITILAVSLVVVKKKLNCRYCNHDPIS
ncbi:hypothetical protein [Stygiolobus azoricus]|uniref:hypothetical protein n=1 Tax=Stygiolobus azoricus TaxID=41675 RepID=UPI0018C8AA6C|nr:hypothetical protein [Stygiolobus azoricus]